MDLVVKIQDDAQHPFSTYENTSESEIQTLRLSQSAKKQPQDKYFHGWVKNGAPDKGTCMKIATGVLPANREKF